MTDPAYRVLAQNLRAAILGGQYPVGARLPTEAELAVEYAVSRQTVRRAFHDLVAEGMVERTPGRGTFAAPRRDQYLRQFGSVDDLMGLSIDTRMQVVRPLRRQIDVAASGRLRLDGDLVYGMEFRRLHNGIPFCLSTVYLHPAVGAALSGRPEVAAEGAISEATVIGLIDAHTPTSIVEAEQTLTAVAAPATVATRLGCATGEPLLRADRLYLTSGDQPVELAATHFLPAQYSYRVRLRRSVR